MNKWNDSTITEGILKVQKSLGIKTMPSRSDVIQQIGNSSLDIAIQRSGGYVFWREKLFLDPKKIVYKWDEEKAIKEIYSIMKILDINRMPSRGEIEMCGKNALGSYITRNSSYREMAKKLNLELKRSETLFGEKWENYCNKFLSDKGYKVKNTFTKSPYDLLINETVKLDVKSGSAYYLRGSRVHTFGINKIYPSCDIYIIYALDENGERIERTFVIPSFLLKMLSLNIGKNSKYNIYLDAWGYLDKYISFYKNLI